MRSTKWIITPILLGYAFLYIPILFLIVFSFNSTQYPGLWSGFSIKWYLELFTDYNIFLSILNSIKIATITATIATFLGILAAVVHIRFSPFKTRKIIGGFLMTPLAVPEVITGFSLLLVLRMLQKLINFPENFGYTTIVIAHTTLALSYVFMLIRNSLLEFDNSIEEAGLDLGATPFQVFLKITLPVILPSVFLGWLLSFVLSWDDVVLASFLGGPGATTLPLFIFSQIRSGITPEINALATILTLVISFVVFLWIRKN